MPDPAPAEAPFKIDGQQVAGFESQDTRHGVAPGGLTAARVERFPGSRNAFAIKGRARRPRLAVVGVLRADSFDALYALIDQHALLAESVATVAVTLHGTDYDPCALMAFETLSATPRAYSRDHGATVGAQIPARFLFEVLA